MLLLSLLTSVAMASVEKPQPTFDSLIVRVIRESNVVVAEKNNETTQVKRTARRK